MPRRRLICWALALFIGVPAAVRIQAQEVPAAATSEVESNGDYIRAEFRGQFEKAAGAREEHAGFQVTSGGVTWEVGALANEALLQKAEQLLGKGVIARGTYEEHVGGARTERVLTVKGLASPPAGRRHEFIEVTVRGTLRYGVMAIGAETTGVTITAGAVTWELELRGNQRPVAERLSGTKAVVSGRLERKKGIEVRDRYVVRARSIGPAMP